MFTTKKVAAVKTKPGHGSSLYWLVLEDRQEVPCTLIEFDAAKKALNSGGHHIVIQGNQKFSDYGVV